MPTIRRAAHTDLEPLGELLDDYRRFYEQTGDISAARSFLTQRLALNDSLILVYEADDGSLAGFVQLYPVLSTVSLASRWLLNDLFVHADQRGHGIGRTLMQAATELAREHGVPQLTLNTQTHNRTAQALYESLGWRRNDGFYGYTLTLGPH